MAYLFPQNIMRLQATAFVSNAELSNKNRGDIIRHAANELSEKALRKIMQDCLRTEDYMGFQGQTLYLDVCVMPAHELQEHLKKAYEAGQKDKYSWDIKFNE